MDKVKTRYHLFIHDGCYLEATIEKDIIRLSKWLGFLHFYYRQCGGHLIFVSVSSLCILPCSLILNVHMYIVL